MIPKMITHILNLAREEEKKRWNLECKLLDSSVAIICKTAHGLYRQGKVRRCDSLCRLPCKSVQHGCTQKKGVEKNNR